MMADENSRTWSGSISVNLSRPQAWDLMWRQEGREVWLGPQSRVDLESDGRWVLADRAGAWRTAHSVKVIPPSSVTIQIDAAASWGPFQGRTTAQLLIAPVSNSRCTITITESGFPARHEAEVGHYWQRRLRHLAELAARIDTRRRSVRQAVVVIHGIGEQQPGETLNDLIASGVLTSADPAQAMWVKPDYFSDSFELRRASLKGSRTRPATDVFEFYWAHLIRDTTLAQVGAWLRQLMLRRTVPTPLRPLWFLAWISLLVAGAATILYLAGVEAAVWLFTAPAVLTLAGLGWRLFGEPVAVDVIGDAARYLSPKPGNIAQRQAIREAGVALVEKLHESGRYDRIVLLGHSLGSVIAYDIITHAWIRMHARHRRPSRPSFRELVAVERALHQPLASKARQALQHAAWRRQRANTQPWLITDLVTVGSPLTYANFLVADSRTAFEKAKSDRVLPCCPPVTELDPKSGHRRISFERPYPGAIAGDTRTFVIGHHAAPFALTRWTNLYFRTRCRGLCGDLIGGPVAPLFGEWVRDVPLASPSKGFTHTWYWRRGEHGNRHLKALRGALGLDCRKELLSLLGEIPAFALLDREA